MPESEANPEMLACQMNPDGILAVRLSGAWLCVSGAPSVEPVRQALAARGARQVLLDGAAIVRWDSVLLVFIRAVMALGRLAGVPVELRNLPAGAAELLRLAEAVPGRASGSPAGPRPAWLARVGAGAAHWWAGALAALGFLGESVLAFGRLVRGRVRWRRRDFWDIVRNCGPAALPIITVISLLVGMILAFMGAMQLKLFGAEIYIADLVGIGMAREMGSLMTAIIMAGRTGASFAAHLGTMQVNEEIDALRTMGFDPMEFLVLPRQLALILMMPLLATYANFLGMFGGALAGVLLFDLTFAQYYTQTVNAVTVRAVAAGLIKSSVYGVLIALSGCMQGMFCGRSASAVGAATTAAVVNAIVYIIVADSVISVIYTLAGF